MAKFKAGDLVQCVKPDYGKDRIYKIGELVTVDECSQLVFRSDGSFFYNDHWELATPEPIPDTVTIGGVEYVRKPEPKHVWAWGQWARTVGFREDTIVFVTGPIKSNGFVPVTYKDAIGVNCTDGLQPNQLTYISTATIPE